MCNYSTNRKFNYQSHLNRKKQCKPNVAKDVVADVVVNVVADVVGNNVEPCHTCPRCLKQFASRFGKHEHIKKVKCQPVEQTLEIDRLRKENVLLKLTINKPKIKRGALTDVIKKQIAADQKWCCSICTNVFDSTYHVDHTIPLWNGGMDHKDNATAMCVSCHAKKTQNEWILRSTME